MNETLCENCNASAYAYDSPKVSIVFEGGRSVDGVNLGRSVFAHQLCGDCCEAVAHLDFAAYVARHEARPRVLELP